MNSFVGKSNFHSILPKPKIMRLRTNEEMRLNMAKKNTSKQNLLRIIQFPFNQYHVRPKSQDSLRRSLNKGNPFNNITTMPKQVRPKEKFIRSVLKLKKSLKNQKKKKRTNNSFTKFSSKKDSLLTPNYNTSHKSASDLHKDSRKASKSLFAMPGSIQKNSILSARKKSKAINTIKDVYYLKKLRRKHKYRVLNTSEIVRKDLVKLEKNLKFIRKLYKQRS